MDPVTALKLALSKEEEAITLYNDLAVKHSAVKDVLLFLVNEESKHKLLLEKKIAELTKY